MLNQQNKKYVRILKFGLIIVVVFLTCIFFYSSKKNEQKNTNVEIAKVFSENKVLIFYEDTCPDCQKVYPLFYLSKLISKRIVLINLNGRHNRYYIRRFDLTNVPTIIHGNQEYSGTKIEKILKIIN